MDINHSLFAIVSTWRQIENGNTSKCTVSSRYNWQLHYDVVSNYIAWECGSQWSSAISNWNCVPGAGSRGLTFASICRIKLPTERTLKPMQLISSRELIKATRRKSVSLDWSIVTGCFHAIKSVYIAYRKQPPFKCPHGWLYAEGLLRILHMQSQWYTHQFT